ncbi:MAG: hypothetical protein VYE19_08160, partial [Chloroflexota bacterium]|nr:hypothetical protein [Chloroflexota bacterium]
FYAPTGDGDRAGPVDAVLLIHGSRGNFYDGATKSMAQDLSAQGYACLPLNTNAMTPPGITQEARTLKATPSRCWPTSAPHWARCPDGLVGD